MRNDPAILSFTSGELSPFARGRIDVERYARAARSLENYIVTPQGAIVARHGTQFTGTASAKALVIPFVANTGNEFVIEITGHSGGLGGIRVWYGPARKLVFDNAGTWNITSTGSIATLNSPWAPADLFDTDGTPLIKFVQSNDVMWLVHPNVLPQKLTRIATYKFSIAGAGDGVNASVPFKDVDPNNTITVQASAATGAGVTLTASSSIFTAAHVGQWFYLERPKVDATLPWETNKAITSGNVRSSNGRYYGATNSATTGTVRPTHSLGTRSDGAVTWDWQDDGYGVAAITNFTSGTQITVTVIRRLPDTVVSGTSTRWAFQAWNPTDGYPAGVCLYRERTAWVRGQTAWLSVAGDYENFQFQDGGLQTPDMAVTVTFGASRNDRAKWIAATATSDVAMIGTASGEFALGPQSSADPFGPTNVRVRSISGYGCNGLAPMPVSESLMFVERGGRRVREARYDLNIDGLASRDLNIYADHIFTRGTCAGLAHQRVPFGVLWATTNGGQLKGFTFQSEQEVWAWHQHVLGGAGLGTNLKPAVRSLCAIASPDGVQDDLWMCVERTINGSTVYYIEVLGPFLNYQGLGYIGVDDVTDVRDSQFLDAGVQKLLSPGDTTITGLTHLTNATCAAVVDGKLVTERALSGTTMSLPAGTVDAVCRAWVGFFRNADCIPVPPVGQSGSGTTEGKKGVFSGIAVRVVNSLNFIIMKPGATKFDRAEMRKGGALMSEASPLVSGDYYVAYPEGSTEDTERPEFLVRQDQPFPLVILGMFPRLIRED